MNKVIAFLLCALGLMVVGYYGRSYFTEREVAQVAAPTLKDESPIFSPGQCIGEKVETNVHYETWEQKPTPTPAYRIEAVGQERYRLRYVNDMCCNLVNSSLSQGPHSWTTFDYIDRKYVLVDCPKEVLDVPLAE